MDSAAERVVSVVAKEDMVAAKEDMAAAKEDMAVVVVRADMAAVAAVAREDSVVVAEEEDGEGRIKANNEC